MPWTKVCCRARPREAGGKSEGAETGAGRRTDAKQHGAAEAVSSVGSGLQAAGMRVNRMELTEKT